MATKFSPSVNIIRDAEREIGYIPTPNAKRIANQIFADFKSGMHAFTLIGSYGTGKSSFLWALEQSLVHKKSFFKLNISFNATIINVVGEFNSLAQTIAKALRMDKSEPEFILDQLYQAYERIEKQQGLLLLVIDEFGKFLEYATQNEPEKEVYFLQQLAEFVNHPSRNILLITTLHQSFEAYAYNLSDAQKQEWNKVKGRFKEIPFNEPVEQLLHLASQRLQKNQNPKVAKDIAGLVKKHRLFSMDGKLILELAENLAPLELISGYVLTRALQKYGQNERSLFTFLESGELAPFVKESKNQIFHLSQVFDYIYYNFYDFLHTKYNPDHIQWMGIKSAIERIEATFENDSIPTIQLIESLGLLNIFCSKGAAINKSFLKKYAKLSLDIDNADYLLQQLESKKIVRYIKFSDSYKLFDGTDLDIEAALIEAAKSVDRISDIVATLNKYFHFPIITAKSITYRLGTPRMFQFVISEEPIEKVPEGEIDGFINLIFNDQLGQQEVKYHSNRNQEAIVYCYYSDANKIKELLFDIEKTNKVIQENQDDKVALRELKTILDHQTKLLLHFVENSLYTEKVIWIFNGQHQEVRSKRNLHQLLTRVCEASYPHTPSFKNELLNKHKITGTIHNARKKLFKRLVENWTQPDLGFAKDKFPPEKTIYLSLVRANGLHQQVEGVFALTALHQDSSFLPVWEACDHFLNESRTDRKNLSELFDVLTKRPLKLKLGLVEFWIPIYLFIKKDEYAFYGEDGYIPEITESHLTLMIKNPDQYWVKAFDVEGVKLNLLNKYRELINREETDALTNKSFIESIQPFLIFYKQLPAYTQFTEKLSDEAKALRKAIIEAEDPEKTFFETFPQAFHLTVADLVGSDKKLKDYISKLKESIKEIRLAYEELINRIEKFIQNEIVGENVDFSEYKKDLINRTSRLKEHLLLNHHKSFLFRVNTETDDRKLWLCSLVHTLLKKPLDQITDREELIFYEKFGGIIRELDNLVEISKELEKEEGEIIKLDLTTQRDGLKENVIRIPKVKKQQLQQLEEKLLAHLSKEKNLNIATLSKLLQEQLKHD